MSKQELVKLMIDAKDKNNASISNYDYNDVNNAIRAGFNNIMGLPKDASEINHRTFERFRNDIFEVIEEVLDTTLNEGITNQLDDFVEYRNLALGDQNEFVMPSNDNFRVSIVSDGNKNLRRQRMGAEQRFSVPTDIFGIKIYEEFSRFMAGRIDWARMVQGVSDSMTKKVKEVVNDAIVSTFTESGADSAYRLTVTGGVPSERQILTMAEHVKARTDENVTIYGTTLALNQLDVKRPSDIDNRDRNQQGYYGTIAGIPTQEIKQAHVEGADEFVFDNDFILILPQTSDKMVKVINEGDAYIQEDTESSRVDMQKEYLLLNKFGIAVIPSSVYGYIKFSGD